MEAADFPWLAACSERVNLPFGFLRAPNLAVITMQNLLAREWKFWLVEAADTSYSVEPIFSVTTVENFWQHFNALPKANEIRRTAKQKISIAVFRDNIKPAWEDEENKSGALYTFQVNGERVQDVWFEVLLGAIGETLGQKIQTPGNALNGVIVMPRNDAIYGIEIWTKTSDEDEEMRKYLQQNFADGPVIFRRHRIT